MKAEIILNRVLVPAIMLAALSGAEASELAGNTYLTLLSQTDYAIEYQFSGTTVGGLSGIDYDAKTNTFISQSDHGSNGGSTHYYTLTPDSTKGTAGYGLAFKSVTKLGPANIESIRFDPKGNGVWYTTEGSPTIYHLDRSGTTTTLPTPANIATRSQVNSSLEGSTFTPNGTYVVSMENALRGDATDLTRITTFKQDGTVAGQFAYKLDTLPGIANPPQAIGGTNNGVSEILALSDTSFLVMERAFDGVRANADPTHSHNSIRIYRVDLTGATNVADLTNLSDASDISELQKQLVFDSSSLDGELDTYGTKIDNIEGMTFGPTLANGHRSFVLVSDNNYSLSQGKTQFLTFDVNPALSAVPLPATLPLFGASILGLAFVGYGLKGRHQRPCDQKRGQVTGVSPSASLRLSPSSSAR